MNLTIGFKGNEVFASQISEEIADKIITLVSRDNDKPKPLKDIVVKRNYRRGIVRKPWTSKEESEMMEKYKVGVSAKVLGKQLNRTPAAIIQRVQIVRSRQKSTAKSIASALFSGQARHEEE